MPLATDRAIANAAAAAGKKRVKSKAAGKLEARSERVQLTDEDGGRSPVGEMAGEMNGGARSIDPSSLNLSQVIHFLEGKAEGERGRVFPIGKRCFPDSTFLNFVSVIFFPR